MYKKINVYCNGIYLYSTNKYKTCKQAISIVKTGKPIIIHSLPKNTVYTYKNNDKITAHFY